MRYRDGEHDILPPQKEGGKLCFPYPTLFFCKEMVQCRTAFTFVREKKRGLLHVDTVWAW